METVNHLITLLDKQFDSEKDYSASEYLTNLYKENQPVCIGLIYNTFKRNNYVNARDVIGAIINSDIEFWKERWFKCILLEGINIPKISHFMSNTYDRYRKELDTL